MLLYFGLIRAVTDLFIEAVETYFHCQALGHLLNQTSQRNINNIPRVWSNYSKPWGGGLLPQQFQQL